MRSKHMAADLYYKYGDTSSDKYLTLCGHDMTAQEYRHAVKRMPKHINCKRCLEKYDKYLKVWDETLDQLLS
jgi:hypothetical protein